MMDAKSATNTSLPPPIAVHSVFTAAPSLLRSIPLPTTAAVSAVGDLRENIPAAVRNAEIPDHVVSALIQRAKECATTNKSFDLKVDPKQPRRAALDRQTRRVFDELRGNTNDQRAQLAAAVAGSSAGGGVGAPSGRRGAEPVSAAELLADPAAISPPPKAAAVVAAAAASAANITSSGMTLRAKKECIVPDVLLRKSARKEASPMAAPAPAPAAPNSPLKSQPKSSAPAVPSQPPAQLQPAQPSKAKRGVEGVASSAAASSKTATAAAAAAAESRIEADAKSQLLALEATERLLNETPQTLIAAALSNAGAQSIALTSAKLSALSNLLAVSPAPFQGLAAETVAEFVARLVVVAPQPEGSSAQQAADGITGEDIHRAMRTLTFFNCISHATFQKSWLAEDALDAAIDALSATVRRVRKALAKLSADNTALPAPIVRLAECIRAASLGAAKIIFGGSLVSPTHLVRLEEVASTALLLHMDIDGDVPPKLCEDLARYTSASVAELHQAICAATPWGGRDALMQSILQKVHLGPGALRRTACVGCDSAVALVSTLTLGALAVAQGIPGPDAPNVRAEDSMLAGMDGAMMLENCHGICRTWVSSFISRFFSIDSLKNSDADEKDNAIGLVTMFAEDLAALTPLPQFPVADYMLRILTASLVRTFLRPGGLVATGALVEKLRASAVDILGKIAASMLKHRAANGHATDAIPDVAPLGVSADAIDRWRAMLAPAAPSQSAAGADAAAKKRKKREQALALPELTSLETAQCSLFHSLSLMAKSAPGGLSSWMCARQYLAALWAGEPVDSADDGRSPDMTPMSPTARRLAPFQPLAQLDPGTAASALSASSSDASRVLAALYFHAMAQRRRSMLCGDGAESLVQAILRTLRDDAEEGAAAGAGWDAARKKAMMHLAKLLDLHPPLMGAAWAVVRQCVCDDAARVRESSVALLQTLLQKVEETALKRGSTESVTSLGYNLVSALLHLLSDRSPAVVAKVISVIAANVATSAILAEDAALSRFVLSKLLAAFMLDTNDKHRVDICLIFAKRWFRGSPDPHDVEALLVGGNGKGESESSMLRALEENFAPLADELVHLALDGLAPPYEITDDHPLAVLLRALLATAEKNEDKIVKGNARGARRKEAEVAKLAGESSSASFVIRGVVRYLLQATACVPPQRNVAEVMACLHLLACVHAAWLVPFIETIQVHLRPPEDFASLDEERRMCLLHACRIVRCALQQTTAIAAQGIASNLTHVLNKYVGPHQQRVLLAAAGGLCAIIEPGTMTPGSRPNRVCLQAVYALMNQYFHRTRGLLPTMHADANHVAYALRFVFLLSEFLRLYPWAKWNTELAATQTAPVPNELASGAGVLENAHRLALALAERAPADSRQKALTIVVRLVGSLCIQHPTEFFRRSEALLRAGLQPEHDAALHIQTLSVVKDFLVDEERRLNAAAAATPSSTSAATSATATSAGGGAPKSLAAALVAGVAEDQNSGMTTWILQRFHREVLVLTLERSAGARLVAFEVIELAVHQGLLAPTIFVEALLSLAAERESGTLRSRATKLLQGLCDRFDDTVTSKAVAGVVRGFDLLLRTSVAPTATADTEALATATRAVLADTDALRGFADATDVVPHQSLFSTFFDFATSCRKRREAFLGGLMRFFYQEGKLIDWCTARLKGACGVEQQNAAKLQSLLSIEGSAVIAPMRLLSYLAGAVALFPFSLENEVLFVLEQIRCGVDLVGETSEAFMQKLIDGAGGPTLDLASAIELAKAVGALLMLLMKQYLRKEYGITPAKMARRAQSGVVGQAYLPQREPQSRATNDFIARMHSTLRAVAPLACLAISESTPVGSAQSTPPAEAGKGRRGGAAAARKSGGWPSGVREALTTLHSMLTEALEEDSKDGMILLPVGGQSPGERPPAPKSRRARVGAKRRPRRGAGSGDISASEPETGAEEDDSDE